MSIKELALPMYLALPHDGEDDGAFVPLARATIKELQLCIDTRAAKIKRDDDELQPLRRLLADRFAHGAKDGDLVMAPGSGWQFPPGESYAAFTVKPVDIEHYWHMLEILPPAAMRDGDFLVGEPIAHRACRVTGEAYPTYRAFFQVHDAHYEVVDPITAAEFNAISAADLQAAIQAGSNAPTA